MAYNKNISSLTTSKVSPELRMIGEWSCDPVTGCYIHYPPGQYTNQIDCLANCETRIDPIDPNVYHIWKNCRTGEKFNITWSGQANSPMNGNQFYTDVQDIVAASIYAGPWWQAAGAGYLPDIVIGHQKLSIQYNVILTLALG
ncbi:MAG TPA: hypothetical protein EYO58_10930 [Flavobacteriales bacterium]|nr:hypothetical protein [Flavobacteriales bacterium]